MSGVKIANTQMQKKKRILVICQHFWPENFRINDTCDYFIERGLEVDVLCGLPNYPGGRLYPGYSLFGKREETHNGVNIHRVMEIPRGTNSNTRIFVNYISFPFFSLFHTPRLLFKNYDKIFIYQLSPVFMAIAGILIGKIKNIETTMHVLDLWPENLYSVLDIKSTATRKILQRTSHWHYKNVDKLIAISERMQTKLKEISRLPDGKVIFATQSCEKIYEKDIVDIELQKRFSRGFNMVFAGNISPAQDFDTVLTAAKKLQADNISINWIIVGDGMSRAWLEEEVSNSGLTDSFYFEGQKPIEDIPKYTHIAHGLLACLVESDLLDATIPAKVMSYLAAGKPMILAMNGEAQRIVNDVRCGFAGPSGNAVELYQNVKKLHALSQKERDQMGTRGRDYHFANFERNMNLQKIYNFIFDLHS